MKAVPLKSQDGKFTSVYFKTKLHLHMGAERGEKVPHWLLCRPVRAEDRSCHHCQEPGGHRLRHRQEVHLKYFPKCKINSLMQALVSPSSGCLALRVLKKKTNIRDVQFLKLHTCILICGSSGFGWCLLQYGVGVSVHLCCTAKQPILNSSLFLGW